MRAKALAAKKTESKSNARPARGSQAAAVRQHTAASPVLALQRAYGNRGVQRMYTAGLLQAKLTTGRPGDVYEREAGSMADRAMNVPETVQRKPLAAGAMLIQRQTPGEKDEGGVQPAEKEERPKDTRAGTLIYEIVLNLDTYRVVFLTNQGQAILGSASTDLKEGVYKIKPDYQKKKWIFEAGQVKEGERFVVNLEGALPWTLAYPESLTLLVTHGFTEFGSQSLDETKKKVADFVGAQQFKEAFELLSSLNDVDLADLLKTLNHEDENVIMVLLTNFQVALAERIEPDRLLVAMESVEWSEDKLYVDNFMNYYVDPSSFSRDKEREKQQKWNIKIYFTYALTPDRGITVYADDIADSGVKSRSRPHYGPGGLLYPDRLSKETVPRMWAAKKEVIKKIEEGNFAFILQAHLATEAVLGLVMAGQGLLASTVPGATTGAGPGPRGLQRPISQAYEAQQGRWRGDFEGGANMSAEARAYEARVCHKDEGMGYYRNGTQFDGFEENTLLDAKHYPPDKGMAKALQKNNPFIGNKLLDQARRQLAAAGPTPIEWRVSNEAAALKIQQLFSTNSINIKVVYYP